MTWKPDREAVARIIDPRSWSNFDYWGARPERGIMSADQLQRMVAPSLAKADAILALSPPAGEAERVRELAEEARAMLRRYLIETPLGHQPHMIAHKAEDLIARLADALEAR